MNWSITIVDSEDIAADVQAFNEDNRKNIDGAKEEPEKMKDH